MIDTKELRIGNWIMGQNDPPMTVREVGDGSIQCSFGPDHLGDYWSYDDDDLYGVPITADILKRAGFIQPTGKEYFVHQAQVDTEFVQMRLVKGYAGWMVSLGDDKAGIALTVIKCFHQLQNIFFILAGEEIMINDFCGLAVDKV
jgi:hypothetical protein